MLPIGQRQCPRKKREARRKLSVRGSHGAAEETGKGDFSRYRDSSGKLHRGSFFGISEKIHGSSHATILMVSVSMKAMATRSSVGSDRSV